MNEPIKEYSLWWVVYFLETFTELGARKGRKWKWAIIHSLIPQISTSLSSGGPTVSRTGMGPALRTLPFRE